MPASMLTSLGHQYNNLLRREESIVPGLAIFFLGHFLYSKWVVGVVPIAAKQDFCVQNDAPGRNKDLPQSRLRSTHTAAAKPGAITYLLTT